MDVSSLPPPRKHIQKVLIANRGEIARRVIKTCKKLGISTVAVYSASDANGVYVREADESVFIGASEAKESYLCIEKIINIAKDLKVDAIHPGYGFLSENADFSAACKQAGIIFIGPSAESILSMGSKSMSKKLLKERAPTIPLIPGYNGTDQSDKTLMEQAKAINFPVLLKASAGGGGKGMRIVRNPSQLKDAIDSAKTESQNSFGDSTLLIEKYFDSVRHIEFQIFGDEFGNVIHINERECSIQRRHQKVIEESPSVVMTPELRSQMGNAAIAIGKVISYVGAGTVEFIVDEERKFYFLEVNTRLQVEHPITEAVTGLDLVEIQIQIARGYSLEELGLTKGLIPIRGHAIECRLYAEDPANDFFPCTGTITKWHQGNFPGLRYDTGIESGSEISIYYDPMISKIITHAESRELAINKMVKALQETIIFGLVTNKVFLQQILLHPEFKNGNFNTHFIGNYFPENKQRNCPGVYINDEILIAATLWEWLGRQQRRMTLKNIPSGWRNNAVYRFQSTIFSLDAQAFKNHQVEIPKELLVEYQHKTSSPTHSFVFQINKKSFPVTLGESNVIGIESKEEGTLACTIDGTRRKYQVVSATTDANRKVMIHSDIFGDFVLNKQPKLPVSTLNVNQLVDPSRYVSPMPGKILRVLATDGQIIKQGDPLLVMESMKMESKVYAQKDGVLKIHVKDGDLVEAGAVLAEVK